MKITLTVPYAGSDRTVTGTPSAIALAASLVAKGLPTIAEMNIPQDLADLGDATGCTTMGMGRGDGKEFISGSHTLLMAMRAVMMKAA